MILHNIKTERVQSRGRGKEKKSTLLFNVAIKKNKKGRENKYQRKAMKRIPHVNSL